MTAPEFPPLDGSLTLLTALDFQRLHNPDLPAYVFSTETNQTTFISFRELARACHRAALSVCPPGTGHDHEIVAVIALADLLVYQTIALGIIRAGLVPFLISSRNSVPAVLNLLKKTSCHRIIATKETLKSLLQGVTSALRESDPDYELSIDEVPSLQTLFPRLGQETKENPFTPYPEIGVSLDDTAVYMHSSGTTGLPKPIPLTHRFMIHNAAFPTGTGIRDRGWRVCSLSLPPFHLLGFTAQVIYPLFGCTSVSALPPVVKKPGDLPITATPDIILEHAVRTKADVLFCVPTFLQVWAQSPEAVEILKTISLVTSGGGPLPPKVGNYLVSEGVSLKAGYGGTEFGAPVHRICRPGDEKEWNYMEFSSLVNIRWVPQGNGLYEGQFLTCDTHCLAVENLPDVPGYTPADLWERHPTKDYLWRIVGRRDDVIVHSTGEKTVPAPLEIIMMQSPLIEGAVVFGHGHDQAGVLIQPHTSEVIDPSDPKQVSKLRNKLWSAVEEANQVAPASSRIFKEMILITSPAKPLGRSPKGGILRRAAIQAYASEIQQLYGAVESNSKLDSVGLPKTWSIEDLHSWLLNQVQDIIPNSEISPSVDLFRQGFDSLSATILRLRLINALQGASQEPNARKAVSFLTQNVIYSYPTIDVLSTFLHNIVKNPTAIQDGLKSHEALITEMIDKYSTSLDTPVRHETKSAGRPTVVLLTGSTGNLGSRLLASLLSNTTVTKVFTLNRPSSTGSIRDRHARRFEDHGLDGSLLQSDKLTMLEVEMSETKLGLSDEAYAQLQDSVTIIIHNAWQLDFNMTLSFYEPNIQAMRNLIDLGRACVDASSLRILFTSSVGIASSWDRSLGEYPEKIIKEEKYAVGRGYGEAKYVAERVLSKSGLQSCSLRIGQIAGAPPTGAWSMSDWVPIILKSSLEMGILPDLDQPVTWMPANIVSDAVLEIAFSERSLPPVANIVHPHPVSWRSMFTNLQKSLLQHKNLSEDKLRIVPFAEWMSQLTECARDATEKDMERIPGIKLLEFFKRFGSGLTMFETIVSQTYSPTLKNADTIGCDMVDLWVKYWVIRGL